MKLIHCADLHLDSPLEANLPPEKVRGRRAELLNTFAKLVRLADEGGVSAILIAGDLFDEARISQRTAASVLDSIAEAREITFYYLPGNGTLFFSQ